MKNFIRFLDAEFHADFGKIFFYSHSSSEKKEFCRRSMSLCPCMVPCLSVCENNIIYVAVSIYFINYSHTSSGKKLTKKLVNIRKNIKEKEENQKADSDEMKD